MSDFELQSRQDRDKVVKALKAGRWAEEPEKQAMYLAAVKRFDSAQQPPSYNVNAAVGPGVRIPQSSLQEATRPERPPSETELIREQFRQSYEQEGPRDEQNFLERAGQDLYQRFGPDLQEQMDRDQSMGSDLFQFAGKQVGGSALDVLGEALVSAYRNLPYAEETAEQFKPLAQVAATEFAQSETGQAAINSALEGYDSWVEFKKENPTAAANVEALGNLVLLGAPVKTSKPMPRSSGGVLNWLREHNLIPKRPTLETTGPRLGRTGGGEPGGAIRNLGVGMRRSGLKANKAKKEAFIQDLIASDAKPAQIAAVHRTRPPAGMSGRLTTEASALEKESIAAAMKTRISPKNTLHENAQILREKVGRLAETLQRQLDALAKSGARERASQRTVTNVGGYKVVEEPAGAARGWYTMDELTEHLAKSQARAAGEPVASGSEAVIKRIYDNFLKALEGKKPTLGNLFRARKEFDQINAATLSRLAKRQQGAVQNETATNIAVRQLRKDVNDFIAARAPNSSMKQSLREQSALLRAEGEVAAKAAVEARTRFGRAFQRVVARFKLRDTSLQVLSAGYFAANAAAWLGQAPGAAAALAIPGLMYVGGRAIASPGSRKMLGGLIRELDNLIKTTTDPNVVRQLRLDRAAVVEMVKSLDD